MFRSGCRFHDLLQLQDWRPPQERQRCVRQREQTLSQQIQDRLQDSVENAMRVHCFGDPGGYIPIRRVCIYEGVAPLHEHCQYIPGDATDIELSSQFHYLFSHRP